MADGGNIEVAVKLFSLPMLLSLHASLRFGDVQRVAKFSVSDAVMHGALTAREGKMQHGLPLPCASLGSGFSNCAGSGGRGGGRRWWWGGGVSDPLLISAGQSTHRPKYI